MSRFKSKDIKPALTEFCQAVNKGNTPFLMRALTPKAAVSFSSFESRGIRVSTDQPQCRVLNESKAAGDDYIVSFGLGSEPWIKTHWVHSNDGWVIADAFKI